MVWAQNVLIGIQGPTISGANNFRGKQIQGQTISGANNFRGALVVADYTHVFNT